jgi:hypothetical protein
MAHPFFDIFDGLKKGSRALLDVVVCGSIACVGMYEYIMHSKAFFQKESPRIVYFLSVQHSVQLSQSCFHRIPRHVPSAQS